jgi:peptidyl-tRNA hydrolase ICT1
MADGRASSHYLPTFCRTESKATTSWTINELNGTLPKLLRAKLRSSRYYTARNDSLTFSAQTERQRSSNVDENKDKLVQELLKIYSETVPGDTDPRKIKKHAEMCVSLSVLPRLCFPTLFFPPLQQNETDSRCREKAFHNQRIKSKKQLSAKKQFRRSSFSE